MPIFTLHRSTPLAESEWSRLPPGCQAVSDTTDVVARADIDHPLGELLAFTATLARAVPDAHLSVIIPGVSLNIPAGSAPASVSQIEASDAGTAMLLASDAAPDAAFLALDPWVLLDKGDAANAEKRFAVGYALDPEGRDRVRAMFHSTDPEQCAFACRIAGYTQWKSFASNLRRMLKHADVRVRRDAVAGIGKLAGPVMAPAVDEMLNDPSPEVRVAARTAKEAIRLKERTRDTR